MTDTFLRLTLVSFAAAVAGRISHSPWPLLAPVVAGVLALVELHRLGLFCEDADARLDEVLDRTNGADLPSGELAAAWPWLLGSAAVLAWALAWRWPQFVPPTVALGLLALAPGGAVALARRLAWPEAACLIGRVWRARVPLPAWRRLRQARWLWVPKRGLLTVGQPRISQVESLRDDVRPQDVLRLAAALYHREETPLGAVLQQTARRARLALPRFADATALPDGTRAGTADGHRYHLGSPALAARLGFDTVVEPDEMARIAQGTTFLVLLNETGPMGLVTIDDPLRGPDGGLVKILRQSGAPPAGLLCDDPPDIARIFGRAAGCAEALGDLDEAGLAVALGDRHGPAAFVTWPGGYPTVAAAVEATVWIVPPDDPAPDGAELVVRGESAAPAALAWSEATATGGRDRRRLRRVLLRRVALAAAAVAGLPLVILVALDGAITLAELRRARAQVG